MNVLIVEDERKTAQLLQSFIENYDGFLVVNLCDSIESAVEYLEKHQDQIDLIFLDIQLADGESFVIFEQIDIQTPVVFCTAYDEYLMQAFNNNGVAYILKPFKEEDVHTALQKVLKLKHALVKTANGADGYVHEPVELSYNTSFVVRFRDKLFPVNVDEIAFVMINNEIVYLFNFKGEKHTVFKRLDEIEAAIDPHQFYRINRQMIVNRKAISEIAHYVNRKLLVSLKINTPEKAIVSRLKVTPFINWLEKPGLR